ncbi:ribosomal protein S18 acetylase RimI-like enzyme [Streptomyces sp. 3330]|nr:GNAT family N-acetyltransferase [Streptomyces sp. 3330]MDR6975263.1 ribosomal protein S18 acetylase RimI-like enzyme [Streptomyces sp. 3330]
MATVPREPGVEGLGEAVGVLREWRCDGAPAQLHPGDLGWFWRFGARATAAAVRTWSRDGRVLAVGLLDEPRPLRLTIAPDARRDREPARRPLDDLTDPERGVLAAGEASVEAPTGALLRDLLSGNGRRAGEPWTPLRRDLTRPVPDPGVRIEVAGPRHVRARTAVQRAAFDRSTCTEEQRHAMAAGAPSADARCLIAHDARGQAVAAVTVWSAGPGRPGLLEPMGVHREHRRRGHGQAIAVAAAAALRELGSSSAIVCTPSANAGAVAAYESAGFRRLPQTRDLCRDASAASLRAPPSARTDRAGPVSTAPPTGGRAPPGGSRGHGNFRARRGD